jgi:hypothetical protein
MGISITDKYFGRRAYYIRKGPDLKAKYQCSGYHLAQTIEGSTDKCPGGMPVSKLLFEASQLR